MIAASTSYHPNRHQFKPEYVKHWNDAKPSERTKLLKDAGFGATNHYSYRTWAFIPPHVREDVIAVLKRILPKPVAAEVKPVRLPYAD